MNIQSAAAGKEAEIDYLMDCLTDEEQHRLADIMDDDIPDIIWYEDYDM